MKAWLRKESLQQPLHTPSPHDFPAPDGCPGAGKSFSLGNNADATHCIGVCHFPSLLPCALTSSSQLRHSRQSMDKD